jgi:hypothetical protein
VKEFLTPLLLAGRSISADALYTHQRFCQEVIAAGGDSLFFVMGNQPTLLEDLRLFFGEPPLDCLGGRTDIMAEKGYGRLTHRLILASPELHDVLARECYEVGPVFCLRRRVEYPLKCTQAYVSGITSLMPTHADTFRLLELIRGHWSIENRLHFRRDVALAEDACRVRKGTAPHALAVLNSFVLALFDFCGMTNTTQYMRHFDAQPLRAVHLLLTSLAENEKALHASQGSGVLPFFLFCHAAFEEETGMLWLLKTRHGKALLSCLKSFSCIPGKLQSPACKPLPHAWMNRM